MQSISHNIVRYSQRSIERTFNDRHTSVETWIDSLPYTVPLEVTPVDGEYLSLDNRRLYSAKNYSPHETVNCIVRPLNAPTTNEMKDFGIDLLEMIWVDHGQVLHRLTLRAVTIEGVMIIRCLTQDSSFPVLGQLRPDPSRGQRTYDPLTWRINPGSIHCAPTTDDFQDSFLAADRILVCVKITVNLYHERNDLRRIIQDRPDLFQLVRYERSTHIVTLRARGEKKDDTWDDWDELLATLSEAESNVRNEYEVAFFNSLKTFCDVYEYDIPEFAGLPKSERRLKEQELLDTHREELIAKVQEPWHQNSSWSSHSIEIVVENSIDFIIKGGEEVRHLGDLMPHQIHLGDVTLILRTVPNPPTIQYDSEAKTEVVGSPQIEGSLVIVELSNKATVVVPCSSKEELGLLWTTKQCFGFTSRGLRCQNRRQSDGKQAWCHHHLSQKHYFESDPSSSSESFVPEWW